MAKLVPKVPQLPLSTGGRDNDTLARFQDNLNKQLITQMTEYAARMNGALMKDGTEAMSGPLSFGPFTTASLPSPVTHPGAVVYDTTINALKSSNGAVWSAFSAPTFYNVILYAAPQDAINAAEAGGGGVVYFPAGVYSVPSGLVVSGSVTLLGAGMNATFIQAWHTDVVVVKLASTATNAAIRHMTIYGKGLNNDTGSFGATKNAVEIDANSFVLEHVVIWGGYYALLITGTDGVSFDVFASTSYGPAVVRTTAANWYIRCKIDHDPTGVAITSTRPYAARANTTVYTMGQVVTLGGYAIACSVGGTSGGSAPALRNYGLPITDGSVTWVLANADTYEGLVFGIGSGENHVFQCDFASQTYSHSVAYRASALSNAITVLTDCALASGCTIETGTFFELKGCEMAGTIALAAGYTGKTRIDGVYGVTTLNVTVGANVTDFIIAQSHFNGGTITIAAGASDYYNIVNNLRVTIVDGAAGANATKSGNH